MVNEHIKPIKQNFNVDFERNNISNSKLHTVLLVMYNTSTCSLKIICRVRICITSFQQIAKEYNYYIQACKFLSHLSQLISVKHYVVLSTIMNMTKFKILYIYTNNNAHISNKFEDEEYCTLCVYIMQHIMYVMQHIAQHVLHNIKILTTMYNTIIQFNVNTI